MIYEELKAWLALWHAPKMTIHRFYQCVHYFEKLENLFNVGKKELGALSLPEETIAYLKQPEAYLQVVEESMHWQRNPHNHIIHFRHNAYPPLLKEISNPPPLLFVKGNPKMLSSPQIAIVGSRHPTPTGLSLAHEFSAGLSLHGLAITSGLALGIDTAAHHGALSHGSNTIAVLGSGFNIIYPAQNKKLADDITERGVLVSEFPLNTPPKRENFPRRNRIVSGLSLGTLVIEASIRSGSLITARLAAEQNREVFAIPGSVKNRQAQGCHILIQQGAKLTSNIEHVLEELKGFDYVAHKNKNPFLSNIEKRVPNEQKVLDSIGYEPTSLDIIQARCGLDIAQLNSILCELLIKNEVENFGNGYIKIK